MSERPGLEVGEDAVDPGQDQVGGHGADDMGFVACGRQSGIARPAGDVPLDVEKLG